MRGAGQYFRSVACMLCLAPSILSAQSDPSELARTAADRLDAASASLQAADSARDRVDALSRTIKAYEEGLEALREGLRQASLREQSILTEFDATSEELSRLIAVLMTIQKSQGPLTLIHPSGPMGTARSGMITSEVTPAVQARARDLKSKLDELAMARALQASAAERLSEGLSGVQQARAALNQALSNRVDLPRQFSADPAAMGQLAESAETLQDFASGLLHMDVGETALDPVRPFESARGTLPLPVAGRLLRGFGEADAAGVERPGLILSTRPKALVTTPWAATIRYAGPLLDYGNVIVLEPESGTLLVLAGAERLYGTPGEVLAPGTPVGMMGGQEADQDGILNRVQHSAGSALSETLYIELRTGNEPIDPAPWFAETKEQSE